MDKNIFFSIITPTYNRSSLLLRCISSVIQQTFSSWEMIVVDDGSTDNTKEIISEINDTRVVYLFQEHNERSAARNCGIERACGQYYIFLDDDDEFLPKHLEVLNDNILRAENKVSIFRTGMIIKRFEKVRKSRFYTNDLHPVEFFLKNMAGIHTLCYHEKILDSISFDERWIHFQDTFFLIQALLIYPLIQIKEHTVVYNVNADSGSIEIFTTENTEYRLSHNLDAINTLFEENSVLLSNVLGDKKLQSLMIGRKYFDYAAACLTFHKKELAKRYFSSFLSRYPNRFSKLYYILSYFRQYIKKAKL